jgi:peptidoglycan/xylan/chitin deacetylase (PgdA/CDA1 family)
MSIARKASKAAVTPLGLPARRRPGDVVILLYHRIGSSGSEIELPSEAFERHLEQLVSAENLLTLDDLLSGGNDGGVVVSFDDGYHDFYEAALPLLVKHRVPAVLYLATGLVEGEDQASPLPGALTWSQLRESIDTGLVTVGSHTHGHVDLSQTTEAAAEDEMRRSKDLIEDHLGTPCSHFAYPWAVSSAASDRAARRLFRTAARDAWTTNRSARIDPYRLGRVPILRSDGDFFFRRKVNGQLDTEAWLYRALGRGPWGRP